MKRYFNNLKILICLSVCIFLLPSAGWCEAKTAGAFKKNESSGKNTKPDRFVSIDFNNVDINLFIKFISELSGKNFIVDHRVRGKVTIISPAKISVKEAFKVFESVLEVHGYTAVKAGEVTKIIPSPDARSKNVETLLKAEAFSPEDKIVTQLIPLKYADPTEIKRLFAPLISKSSVILAYEPTNMLVVTDIYSNILRLLEIVKAIDVTGIGQEISVIPLEFADAEKLVSVLDTIFQQSNRLKKTGIQKTVKFVADDRTNTIVVLASEVDTQRINDLIKLLDKEVPRGEEKIRVYYLENATAEELAKVLQSLAVKQDSVDKGKKTTPIVSEKVKITADKATNSLIIMAEKDDYLVLEEIIKKLDIPRTMVYIESLIMEVNVDKAFDLGIEWNAGEDINIRGTDGAVGGGFSGSDTTPYGNTAGLLQGSLPSGFSVGVFAQPLEIAGIEFPNLGAVVQAYKKDKDVHILSTPQILTTDNEEAIITVGKNVPYQTRSTQVPGLEETYSSFEYKDVGISLKITPHITKDRLVRLDIEQELTKLESTTDFRPTTLKRTIDTTVIVEDKNTVVIGGLIDDSFTNTEYKVPCLGDVPLVRHLFKSISKSGEKTNLFVFLTPKVIGNPADAKEIYNKKKTQIESIEKGSIKMYKENKDISPPQSLVD